MDIRGKYEKQSIKNNAIMPADISLFIITPLTSSIIQIIYQLLKLKTTVTLIFLWYEAVKKAII